MNPFDVLHLHTLLLLTLSIPFLAAILMPLTGGWPNLREACTIILGIALLLVILVLRQRLLMNETDETWLLGHIGSMLEFSLRAEPLGILFALVAAALWPVTSLYSIGYMRGNKEVHQTRYYACFALAIACTMGIALAANLFTTFVFYEALTLVTLPLVTHSGTEEARRSGRLYIGMLMGASLLLLLPAIIWIGSNAGTLDFRPGGILRNLHGPALGVLLFLCVYGVAKAAIMPMHRWLPAAMIAPAPVSALLHAVAVVKAGAFLILKLLIYVFGVDFLREAVEKSIWAGGWLTYTAGASVLISSIIALRQDEFKRLLAYSTISHLGYIVLSAAVLAPISVMAAALHIVAHAFAKITLFFAAGSIYTASEGRTTCVSQFDGIGRRMPVTMAAFTVGALALLGLPPTLGFLSKWFMLEEAWITAHYEVVAVLILSTLLNGAYLLPVVHRAFFRTAQQGQHSHGEAPLSMQVAIGLSAAGCVGLFLFPNAVLAPAVQLIHVMIGAPS